LGKDVLLAVGFYGHEGLSQLFRYTIDAKAARGTGVPLDGLVGQSITVALETPGKKMRFFNGVCVRAAQGESDNDFTDYQLEVVPKLWTLTKRSQSRIFQQKTVPQILKEVLADANAEQQLAGKYEPRDFCAQYRETDFNFACRLMEEEGLFYFFKHADGKHTMVVADTPQAHEVVPGKSPVVYKNVNMAASGEDDYVAEVMKVQEQTAGKFLLWDHTFEMAANGRHDNHAAEKLITDAVKVGQVAHKLKVGDSAKLEVYDWPGEYAQRFDGIDPAGGEQPAEVAKVSPDGKRTVDLRMQQEAATAVRVQGAGSVRNFATGYKFTLATLPTDPVATPLKGEGEYVLTTLQHTCRVPATYRSGSGATDGEGFHYANTFTALPSALPFRPPRTAAKPVVSGSQSAVVVGPAGEEIFTDKYGRIKVQFHWDRLQSKNAQSSCWVRVAHASAGRHWGSLSIPRVGQEVLIDFLEGDPDQPICVGCVYNPDQMPMYKLPDERTKSYVRTNSSPGGVGYNEIRFEDKASKEQVYVHAQRNMDERVRNDSLERVGNNRHLRVGFYLPNDHKGDVSGEKKQGSQFEEVAVNQHLKVHGNKDEHVGGNSKLLVGGVDGPGRVDVHIKDRKLELIDKTSDLHVKEAVKEKFDQTYDLHVTGQQTVSVDAGADLTVGGDRREKVGGSVSLTVGQDHQLKAGMKHAVDAGMEIHLKAGMKVVLEAMQISLVGPGGFVDIGPSGVTIQGLMVLINSGGAAGSGSGAKPATPQAAADAADAADANPTKPTDADYSKTGEKSNT
jgi:type VI secretion system secreted protein VgrG